MLVAIELRESAERRVGLGLGVGRCGGRRAKRARYPGGVILTNLASKKCKRRHLVLSIIY